MAGYAHGIGRGLESMIARPLAFDPKLASHFPLLGGRVGRRTPCLQAVQGECGFQLCIGMGRRASQQVPYLH